MSPANFGPTDLFGMPTLIFGVHEEDFFALLGRVIAISAVIERDLRSLARKLVEPGKKNDVATIRTTEALSKARHGLHLIGDERQRAQVSAYVDDVKQALERRDAYCHGMWPAASIEHGTRVVGWRMRPGMPDFDLGNDLTFLRGDVEQFSELVVRWIYEISTVVSALPWLQPPAVSA